MAEVLICKECGLTIRRKRLAQRYCGQLCQDKAKKRRKRRKFYGEPGTPILLYREPGTDQQKPPAKSIPYKPYIPRGYPYSRYLYRITESGIFYDPVSEEYCRPYEGDWGSDAS